MQSTGSAKTIIIWVTLASFFSIAFTPLIVSSSLFFPFITGKAFFFRALVEIAFAGWVALALVDREYRPRYSLIGVVVAAFVGWMFIADLFAINVTKAFWSNFERMEGWVLLVHLAAFFFAASNVLRVEKKWREWFLASVTISAVLVGYAFLQLGGSLAIHQGSTRIDATFGNSAYFAIYLLFNVCIAAWLALTEKRTWLKWSLLVLAGIQSILIFYTETRGAVLGLIGALALAALLTALSTGKRWRRFAIGSLVALILVVGGIYAAKNSSFVEGNRILNRVTSISMADGNTRFTIWSLALEGFKERPIVGWGQEGFNYVFNKYYKPTLYGQESWFDRAHNAFIDWLMAGGLPAFLLYLSLFGVAAFSLWKHANISRVEKIALSAALVGYAVHNLFVFDNLYSYIYFFAILAMIDAQVGRTTTLNERPIVSEDSLALNISPVIVVALIAVIWYVIIRGMNTAGNLVTAISPQAIGFEKSASLMQDLLSSHSPYKQEVAEQSVSLFAQALSNKDVAAEIKQKLGTLAISGMNEQVSKYPDDARERLQLAYAYQNAGLLDKALDQVNAAIALSPQKPDFFVQRGVIEWAQGNLTAARDAFKEGYDLSQHAPGMADYVAAGEIALGNMNVARDVLQQAHGTTTVDSPVLEFAYTNTKRWPELIALWKMRVAQSPNDPQQLFSLAAIYYRAGDVYNAVQTLQLSAARFPETQSAVTSAIKQIQSGKVQ